MKSVVVPVEPTEAMLRAGWELADFNPLRDGYVGQVYRAMLAAAPIVPASAYGVKEALEPFAKEAENWLDTIPDHVQMSAFNIALGDLRRARTAYDSLSSAPVEEADAKAAAELEAASEEDILAGIDLTSGLTPSAPTISSEPEAKGEAGAGPVGEAVAWLTEWQFHAPEDRKVIYPGGGSSIERLPEEAEAKLAHLQGWDRVDWVRQTPLYARPVEELGVVERLTRDRDEAVQNAQDLALDLASAYEKIAAAKHCEASLAETRERLEKELSILEQERVATLAALRLAAERLHEEGAPLAYVDDARSVLLGFTPEGCRALRPETTPEQVAALFEELSKGPVQGGKNAQIAYAKCAKIVRSKLVRAALSTQESSAALAGDGKEAGR